MYSWAPSFTGEFLLLFPTSDGNSSKSHAPGELDSEMPQTADALYGDEIARAQVGVPERVIGCDPRTEQRRCVCRRNSVRNRGESSRFNDYDFGISAIGRDTRNDQVLADCGKCRRSFWDFERGCLR
jgi:hypothetical protein